MLLTTSWLLSCFSWYCLPLSAPLQLRGCTRALSLSSSTTPSGASGLQAFFCACALHFDHGVEQACSDAARVPRRQPIPGLSLLARLAFLRSLLRGDTSCRGSPLADPFSARSALPFSLSISSSFSSPVRKVYGFRGRRMCFPVCVRLRLWPSCLLRPLFCLHVPPGREVPGRPAVFPGRAHVRDGGLPWEGHRVYCVLGSRSHLVFLTSLSREWFEWFRCCLSLWGLRVSRWKNNR